MEKDIYRVSRINYIIEEAVAYLIALLLSGAYIAKLTTSLGFSDGLTAILTAFVSLGCSFQLFALMFFKKGKVKKRVTSLFIINQLLFMVLYLVPAIRCSHTAKIVLFILCLLFGYFAQNVVFSPKTNWFMSLVPNYSRGNFTAIKEAVSLVSGMVFSFVMSAVIDKYENAGNINAAFTVCAVTIFVLAVVHALTLIFSKEKEPEAVPEISLKRSIKGILSDKNVLIVFGISLFWAAINNITTPFFGTYEIKELGFSMTFVSILTVIGTIARITASFFLGRYADKTSFAKMLKICYILMGLAFVTTALAVPSNGAVMFVLHKILHSAAMGGINSAEINLIYDYIAPEKRISSLAVKQTLYGVVGFVSTLVATPLLSYIQKSGNTFWGVNAYAQQVLSVIAIILVIAMIIYLDKVVARLKTYDKI